MEIIIILLILVILLLVIPIPIKIKLNFINGNLNIRIFNKNLDLSKSQNKKKVKKNKKYNKNSIFYEPYFYKVFFSKLKKRKFKPKIKINGFINYSLGDAALTAISYGFLSTTSSFLYIFLNIIFNFKNSHIKINPLLQKEANLGINITCIIFISFGHIIHIFILLLISIIRLKEVSLFGKYE